MSLKAYAGWDTDEHRQTFDLWNRQSDWFFNFAYGNFAEQRYLLEATRRLKSPLILDIGCATGTTYRFLRNSLGKRNFRYRGIDISGPAISRACTLYPGIDFTQKGLEPLREFVGQRCDIVFSRDTVMHQIKPYDFLGDLLSIAERYLILRLRTRDDGPTEHDVERSCQMHYGGFWMPYIVLNIVELIKMLSATRRVAKVTINRSYEVLGGNNYRFLPKDLYLKDTGGAETSLLIELCKARDTAEPDIVFEQKLEGHAFLRKHRYQRAALAMLSRGTEWVRHRRTSRVQLT